MAERFRKRDTVAGLALTRRYLFGEDDADDALLVRETQRMLEQTPLTVTAAFYATFPAHDELPSLAAPRDLPVTCCAARTTGFPRSRTAGSGPRDTGRVTPDDFAFLTVAGLLAGGVNAVAGGGSLISFPALLAAGYPPVTANVTNTVALLPGYAGSVAGGRRELRGSRATVVRLGAVCVVGALAGAALLLTTPDEVFRQVVPFLVLLACGLLALQPRLARRRGGRARKPLLLQGSVLLAAVYGAYFGAGLGILLLGLLGVLLADELRRTNALKNVLSLLVNAVAVVAFALFGPVAWDAAAVVAATSLVGGYLGARIAARLPSPALRVVVVGYGVVVAVLLL